MLNIVDERIVKKDDVSDQRCSHRRDVIMQEFAIIGSHDFQCQLRDFCVEDGGHPRDIVEEQDLDEIARFGTALEAVQGPGNL